MMPAIFCAFTLLSVAALMYCLIEKEVVMYQLVQFRFVRKLMFAPEEIDWDYDKLSLKELNHFHVEISDSMNIHGKIEWNVYLTRNGWNQIFPFETCATKEQALIEAAKYKVNLEQAAACLTTANQSLNYKPKERISV